jgi:hypothetical protein
MPIPLDSVDDLYVALVQRLTKPGYSGTYTDEASFEADVWDRVFSAVSQIVQNPGTLCLTSHTAKHKGRSGTAWKAFCREERGPDVKVLGSNNRLDVVVKHPSRGSIGIEVKCLGKSGHTAKLTQGIGQAMLALVHRDRTILMIHCGAVGAREREHLRKIAEKICRGSKTSIIVVP